MNKQNTIYTCKLIYFIFFQKLFAELCSYFVVNCSQILKSFEENEIKQLRRALSTCFHRLIQFRGRINKVRTLHILSLKSKVLQLEIISVVI